MKTVVTVEVTLESTDGDKQDHLFLVHELTQNWGDATGGVVTNVELHIKPQ